MRDRALWKVKRSLISSERLGARFLRLITLICIDSNQFIFGLNERVDFFPQLYYPLDRTSITIGGDKLCTYM